MPVVAVRVTLWTVMLCHGSPRISGGAMLPGRPKYADVLPPPFDAVSVYRSMPPQIECGHAVEEVRGSHDGRAARAGGVAPMPLPGNGERRAACPRDWRGDDVLPLLERPDDGRRIERDRFGIRGPDLRRGEGRAADAGCGRPSPVPFASMRYSCVQDAPVASRSDADTMSPSGVHTGSVSSSGKEIAVTCTSPVPCGLIV